MKTMHINTSIPHFYDFYALNRCDKDWPMKTNWHDDIEILFTINGENTFLINGEEVTLRENEVYIINPHYSHSSVGERNGHTSVLTVTNMFLIDNGFKDINGFFTEKIVDDTLFDKCNKLLDLHYTKSNFREIDMRICLLGIFKYIFEYYYTPNVVSSKNYKINNVLKYLEKNYTENITLEELALKFNYNKNYLSMAFKKETGYNIIRYINLMRCNYADSLIKNTTLKMNEIAIMAGFRSVSNFNKIYKSIRNKTPIVTRNDNKQYLENGRGLGRRLKKQIELPIE